MYIADFHIHSKYSRATSKNMEIEEIVRWAKYKGINLVGTGDFTHFLWLSELKEKLKETERNGIYTYNGVDFILTAEVCNIFEKKGKVKKIHNIIFLPSFDKVEKFNSILERYGELNVDGRPILQMEAKELIKILLEVDENGFVVPAHIWTPHFSLFGSNSGFDRIEDCFEEYTDYIFALETGLSSDPAMNWMLSSLDRFTLISNSDAHSPAKLGREANVFKNKFDFLKLRDILKNKDKNEFLFTIEYFPEEGKYHYDGHRHCKVCLSPEESVKNNNICPVCGRKLTIGVLHRVYQLSERKMGEKPQNYIEYKKLIPLDQIIGFVMNKVVDSHSVKNEYLNIVNRLGSEFEVLLNVPEEELYRNVERKIAEGIVKVRKEKVKIHPGYDGEFGKIEILLSPEEDKKQQTLF